MLVSIFYEPTRVFRALKEKPTWLIPLIFFLVVMTIATYFIMPAAQKAQLAAIDRSEVYSAEQKAQIKEQMEQNKGFAMIGVIASPIFWVVLIFISVGFTMLMGNAIFGGKARFAQVFSMIILSFMTWVIGTIIKTPLIVAKDSIDVRTSLAIVLPGETTSGPLYSFLNTYTDIFVVWQLVILVIGVKIMYDFVTSKAVMTVLIPTGVMAAISIALGSLFG